MKTDSRRGEVEGMWFGGREVVVVGGWWWLVVVVVVDVRVCPAVEGSFKS